MCIVPPSGSLGVLVVTAHEALEAVGENVQLQELLPLSSVSVLKVDLEVGLWQQ